MIEKLTDEDRARVRADEYEGQTLTPKLVRIIDAHTAVRAGLVQDRDEWQQVSRDWRYRAEQAEADASKLKEGLVARVAQVEELTRERDEAQKGYSKVLAEYYSPAKFTAQWERANAAERERDEARAELEIAWEDDPLVPELRAEVTRLTEALAAAERDSERVGEPKAAAEARVRELEAEAREASEESLYSAAALVAEALRDFQLAADWKARFEAAEADATVAQDRLAALQAKVDTAKRLATEALRDSDDQADALAHVLEALRGIGDARAPGPEYRTVRVSTDGMGTPQQFTMTSGPPVFEYRYHLPTAAEARASEALVRSPQAERDDPRFEEGAD